MAEDHLDKATSISVEQTGSGLKARANVRTINALDRLVGSGVDWLAARVERGAAKARAKTDAEIAIIKSAASVGIDLIKGDPELAKHLLQQQVGVLLHRQINKEEVVEVALEDLKDRPPTDQESIAGGDQLDPDFLNRFERFAEDATSETLREKWGKILAAEVRKPGTFSTKVMRIVDELDPKTASHFEQLCEKRLGEVIPKCLSGQLSFDDKNALVTADLILDPGTGGQIRRFVEAADEADTELWVTFLGPGRVSIARNNIHLPNDDSKTAPLTLYEQKPAIPVYILTAAGASLASIFDDQQSEALKIYCDRLDNYIPNREVREYHLVGTDWQPKRILNST